MADPLSLASSIIALAVFVQATATTLQTVIQGISSFQKELDGILIELQLLSLVLSCLEKSVADSKSAFTTLSSSDLNITRLLDVLEACKPTIAKIERKVALIKDSAGRSAVNRLRVGFFWSATKKDLQELRCQLEYHKTTLILSVQLKSLEVSLVSSATTQETKTQLSTLLRQTQELRANSFNISETKAEAAPSINSNVSGFRLVDDFNSKFDGLESEFPVLESTKEMVAFPSDQTWWEQPRTAGTPTAGGSYDEEWSIPLNNSWWKRPRASEMPMAAPGSYDEAGTHPLSDKVATYELQKSSFKSELEIHTDGNVMAWMSRFKQS